MVKVSLWLKKGVSAFNIQLEKPYWKESCFLKLIRWEEVADKTRAVGVQKLNMTVCIICCSSSSNDSNLLVVLLFYACIDWELEKRASGCKTCFIKVSCGTSEFEIASIPLVTMTNTLTLNQNQMNFLSPLSRLSFLAAPSKRCLTWSLTKWWILSN